MIEPVVTRMSWSLPVQPHMLAMPKGLTPVTCSTTNTVSGLVVLPIASVEFALPLKLSTLLPLKPGRPLATVTVELALTKLLLLPEMSLTCVT